MGLEILKHIEEIHNSLHASRFWIYHTLILIVAMLMGGFLALKFNSKIIALIDRTIPKIKELFNRRR
jgi:hypothetical protein